MLIRKCHVAVGCDRRQLISTCSLISMIAACLFGSGCDSPSESFTRAEIKGSVKLDDQPLDNATIRFIPIDNTIGPKTEFPITQGEFASDQTKGPPIGMHRVEINFVDQEWQHDDEQAIEKLQQSPRTKISRPTLPDRYHKLSTLTAIVEASVDDTVQILTFPLSSRTR